MDVAVVMLMFLLWIPPIAVIWSYSYYYGHSGGCGYSRSIHLQSHSNPSTMWRRRRRTSGAGGSSRAYWLLDNVEVALRLRGIETRTVTIPGGEKLTDNN